MNSPHNKDKIAQIKCFWIMSGYSKGQLNPKGLCVRYRERQSLLCGE